MVGRLGSGNHSEWTINATTKSQWIPGGEIFEYICQGDN